MNERLTSTQSRSGLGTFVIGATWTLLTLITLPLAILAWLFRTTEWDCDGPWGFVSEADIEQCKQQAAADSSFAGGMLALWLLGSVVLLLIAVARRRQGPERTIACPHCNLEVSVGVPTCLRCGHTFARM
jgi:hypothetical protein